MSEKKSTMTIILENTPAFDEMGDMSPSERAQFLVDHLNDANKTIETLRARLAQAEADARALARLMTYATGWCAPLTEYDNLKNLPAKYLGGAK